MYPRRDLRPYKSVCSLRAASAQAWSLSQRVANWGSYGISISLRARPESCDIRPLSTIVLVMQWAKVSLSVGPTLGQGIEVVYFPPSLRHVSVFFETDRRAANVATDISERKLPAPHIDGCSSMARHCVEPLVYIFVHLTEIGRWGILNTALYHNGCSEKQFDSELRRFMPACALCGKLEPPKSHYDKIEFWAPAHQGAPLISFCSSSIREMSASEPAWSPTKFLATLRNW